MCMIFQKIKKKKSKSQECTDNTIQDLVVNKCDVTDLNKNKKNS